jgi:hypothetical protein
MFHYSRYIYLKLYTLLLRVAKEGILLSVCLKHSIININLISLHEGGGLEDIKDLLQVDSS